MKTQGQISDVVIQPQAVTVRGAHRADTRFKTTRGVAILALVLGGLGAATAESLSHNSAGHAGVKHPVGTVRLAHSGRSSQLPSLTSGTSKPWMY